MTPQPSEQPRTDRIFEERNAPQRVRRCTTHHACNCREWAAMQFWAEAAAPDPVASPARPRIVCICGSTRFAEHMNTLAEELTLAGMIVVRPEVIAYRRERDQQFVEPDVKAMLDELHFRKIDLADEVLVVTVDHYIGESTQREIDYARSIGKPVDVREYGPLADPVATPTAAVHKLATILHQRESAGKARCGPNSRGCRMRHRMDAASILMEVAE